MGKQNEPLSAADQLIIGSYKTTMEGLAAYYGEAFEFVLHDLTDLDHSIIRIINGFHSDRKEGAPITDFALSMLEQIDKTKASPSITYFSRSKYGKPVKSTTIVIFGEQRNPIGLMCINLYLDSPLSALLDHFSLDQPSDFISESFINNSNELILRAMEKIKTAVNDDNRIMVSQKNKEIITLLYHQGIFKLKDAVQITASELNISKNTVYLHIRSMEKS
ncbi:MAG: PAS domain-containing protein [Spirochaetaceae bacterium]|jgi:predicted transcriptional regulator YheO|nr:PAS domain-containing protein [Spirochaetaceae bacterium]